MDFGRTAFKYSDARQEITSASNSSYSSGSSADVRRLAPEKPKASTTDGLPRALLENWTRLHSSRLSTAFYTRLLGLSAERLNNVGKPLKTEALKDFLEFWSTVSNDANEPEITVAKDGGLYAEWFKSPRQRLDLKFTGDLVVFGLFDNARIVEGADSYSTVSQILSNHSARPLRWQS